MSPKLTPIAVLLSLTAPVAASTRIDNLRCEYLTNPIGIDAESPRLSWIVDSNEQGQRQTAYEVLVASRPDLLRAGSADLWDSGVVDSSQTVGIDYRGKAIGSGQRAWWTVRVWDANHHLVRGPKPGFWERGLIAEDWKGEWVGLPEYEPACPFLRKEFEVAPGTTRARAYVSARGLYKLYVDGKQIGNGIFTPGWTDYRKRIQYQTYDLDRVLKPGKHVIGLVLGDGWYCGHVAWAGMQIYGPKPMGLVQLDMSGSSESQLVTDESWKYANGPIEGSDLIMGESYDARRDLGGWCSVGYNDSAWKPVSVQALDHTPLIGQHSPTVEQLAVLKPISIKQPKTGMYVFDIGQNMVGWVRLKVQGVAGNTVQLRFAEMLNPDGTIYTTNLRHAAATERYTLSGAGTEVFEPSFTFHGFRYVEVTGFPGTPSLSSIEAINVGSANPATGSFLCSNDLVNKIQHNILWGQRSNYLEAPTDCPQRDERLGWMGDAQIFIKTATLNADVDAFMNKWTQDIDDEQTPEGEFADVSPRISVGPESAPAWGDAGVIVPWTVYLAYDDLKLLHDRYPAMKRWIDMIDNANPDHIWIHRSGANYGDWLNVNADMPRDVLATAYFSYSTSIVARAAQALGYEDDAKHYSDLHDQIRDAFQSHFVSVVHGGIHVKGDTQTCFILALHFNLLPDSLRAGVAKLLADDIEIARQGHLSTGFVGVGYSAPTLTSVGRTDIAYQLLQNDTYPSWGFEVKNGATTIWERWDGWTPEHGFEDPGMNSFNHYAFGSIGQWLYETVAGITLDERSPGYSHTLIKPEVGRGITWEKASFQSVHGLIRTSWNISGKTFQLDVQIPANTTATVIIPGSGPVAPNSPFVKQNPDGSFEISSGKYRFESQI